MKVCFVYSQPTVKEKNLAFLELSKYFLLSVGGNSKFGLLAIYLFQNLAEDFF